MSFATGIVLMVAGILLSSDLPQGAGAVLVGAPIGYAIVEVWRTLHSGQIG